MDFANIAEITGYDGRSFRRAHRMLTLCIVAFLILLGTALATGFFIHHEVMNTYTQNYQMLEQAGFSDIIAAPSAVNERLILVISAIPLFGAGLFFPVLYLAAREFRDIVEEAASAKSEHRI